MEDEIAKLRRQTRWMQISLIFLTGLILFLLALYAGADKKVSQTPSVVPGVTAIPGPKGDVGEKGEIGSIGPMGPQGIQGIAGPKGKTGDTGVQGPQGVQGVQGPIGEPGPQGIPGEDGQDGTNGRKLELRCNTETQQFEQRYEGDETWEPIEGSDCVAGNGNNL